ncbi:uncharacterized protein [Palaemon carinicauda]|uniref:uncharacterized protein n=1 Tax=Palaemon carinicauda TaxID=392227 RepID=UPI0035B6424C
MRILLQLSAMQTILVLALIAAEGPSDNATWVRSRRICSPRQVDIRAYEACHLTRRRSVASNEKRRPIGSHLGLLSSSDESAHSRKGKYANYILSIRPNQHGSFPEDFGQFKRRMKTLKKHSKSTSLNAIFKELEELAPKRYFKRQVTDVPDWRELNVTTYEQVRLFCCRRPCPPEAYYGIC